MIRINQKDIISEKDNVIFEKIKMGIDKLLDSDDDYNENQEIPELDTALAEQDWWKFNKNSKLKITFIKNVKIWEKINVYLIN